MNAFNRILGKQRPKGPFHNGYVKFRSSIYGRVVFIITISSVFLFVSFGVIFRSVNEEYMKSVIRESGNNVGFLVEGALYRSMLANDESSLQSTLDIINTMSGIDEVNMYDDQNVLAYSSISSDSLNHSDPDCISCHKNFATMFSHDQKSYKIIDVNSECSMNHNNSNCRHLVIKSPIMNGKSCYESTCHYHGKNEKVLGSLIIKIPLDGLDAALKKSTTDYLLLAALMTILLILFLIFFTSKKIREPLGLIISASEAVAHGDKSTRLEIKPNQLSDIRMVSIAFNEMLDNLRTANNELQNWSQQLEYKVQKKTEELGQAQNELINIERIASLGRLSLSVAHEINNPLSGILVYAKLIYKQLENQDIEPTRKQIMLKNLKLIENETKRCGDIVKGLLDFSKKDQNDFEPKHLHDILLETRDLMGHPMKIANISFLTEFSATEDMIFCSPNQIKQACIAILVNASEAITENGEIVFRSENPDGHSIRVEITDNGSGISEDDIPHIFEPFFSTKENTSGIGLGLAIVHGIIQSHKGRIEVKSERGSGTTISFTLPLLRS
jgi:two-component system, NtrC family, sensor kinase